MKRAIVFTTVILLVTFVSFSQSLSLVYEGNPIPENFTIGAYGPANYSEIIVEFEVTNNSSSSVDIFVKKVENSIIAGSVNTFCWAGLCYSPTTYVSPLYMTLPAGGTSAIGDFSGHYNPQSYAGQSSISYVFFDGNNVNDSVMVTVLFYTSITGINPNIVGEFTISNPYPNPAKQFVKFDYDLNKYNYASMKIFSLVGSLIFETPLTEESGTLEIATDKLQNGFYFYVLSSSDKELKTGRFVVSH